MGQLCYIITCRTHWLRDLGGVLSPMNAFLFLQGLETLHLRMPRHSENALAVARFLEAHPAGHLGELPGPASRIPDYKLAQKYLPKGAGAILGFGIKGGRGGRTQVHRVGQTGLAPGQHRRRQDAGDPSGLHHPQPADARGIGRPPASPTTTSA